MRVRLLSTLGVLVVAALAAPAAASAVTVGIADQKPKMFTDARFAAAGFKHARVAIGWDALSSRWQTHELEAWLEAARVAGADPLVSFGHSRTDGRRRVLPSPERFRHEFRRFRAQYPWVRDFATWNEANHCGEPTCHRPRLVAAYYRVLRTECQSCRILAAELLDQPNMVSWVREFRRHSRVEPRYWGLHNYLDVNRFRTTATRALLNATRGQIWFTETGGIVGRRNKSRVSFEQSPRHAAEATRWVFDRLVPLSPRITRVYLYHWNAERRRDTWDSALIDRHGRERPAFRVLRARMSSLRAAARRRATARAKTAGRR
jgi:hypothetical protein